MPFYTELKIIDSDSDSDKLKKQRVAERLLVLKSELSKHLNQSNTNSESKNSVKIGTWNLREFGAGKYAGRDFEALYYIAEIISNFDIMALQEIRANLTEFKELKRILGPEWLYIATDVADGKAGNGERMVFLYNRKIVQFGGIAGELTLKEGGKIRASFGERLKLENGLQVTLPQGAVSLSGTYKARLKSVSSVKKLKEDLEIPLPDNTTLNIPNGSSVVIKKNTVVTSPGRGKASVDIPNTISGNTFGLRLPEDSFDDSLRQFARTPFLISFQSGWLKINLCTVHIYYGDTSDKKKLEQRRREIELLTKSLASKADNEFKLDDESFLGVLGDFNIIGKNSPTMEALESNNFVIPEELKSIPGSNVKRDMAYDQIAFWKPKRVIGSTSLDILGANIFDFYQFVFKTEDEAVYRAENDNGGGNGLKGSSSYSKWRTYKMSDHLPMWIRLRTDFSQEYLEKLT